MGQCGEEMLIGKYEHNLDNKGRISIPAKVREVLRKIYKDERLILTSYAKYLVAYPVQEWLSIGEKIRQSPNMEQNLSDSMRILFSNASEVGLDKQGRILIPPPMRLNVGIDKAVIMIGVMNKIEIWAQEKWLAFEQSVQVNREKLAAFGI